MTRLLLHICCGPCASAVLEKIKPDYEITGYFYNPNIYPKSEYDLRLENLNKLASKIGKINNVSKISKISKIDNAKIDKLKFAVPKNDVKNWQKKVVGLEKEKEGGKRCEACIKFRLEKTAEFAMLNGFEMFGTTLSISPYKNTMMINRIGLELEKKYGVKFLEQDFSGLYKRSIELCKLNGIYRQRYCGCEYSRY
ncbi:MAG: epoxyqueuosine reductase QueH [Patescibacteria group bacterium]|jgi:hypothetical protein